jgi:hypothetical protein
VTTAQVAGALLLTPVAAVYLGILGWTLPALLPTRKPTPEGTTQPRKDPPRQRGKHRKPPGQHATGHKHARRKATEAFPNPTTHHPRKATP